MDTLIQVTTGEQGSPVVSARELHTFLEVKSRFADWFKNRVKKYPFAEGQDYISLSKNLENGGRELDYALTLDMAKELSMVERTDKGKQARAYFIDAEKTLRQLTAPVQLSTEQVLMQLVGQQTQLLTNQQEQLSQLRADVEQIRLASRPPRSKPRPTAEFSLRNLIGQQVDAYCNAYGCDRREAWNYLYKRLFQVYSINAHRLVRVGRESTLDALERYGHLDKLYALTRAELSTQP